METDEMSLKRGGAPTLPEASSVDRWLSRERGRWRLECYKTVMIGSWALGPFAPPYPLWLRVTQLNREREGAPSKPSAQLRMPPVSAWFKYPGGLLKGPPD